MTSSDVHGDSGVMTESHATPTKAPKTILFLLKTCLTCVECRKEYQKRELAAWNKPKLENWLPGINLRARRKQAKSLK